MAINLICPKCAGNLSVKAKICKSCDYKLRYGKNIWIGQLLASVLAKFFNDLWLQTVQFLCQRWMPSSCRVANISHQRVRPALKGSFRLVSLRNTFRWNQLFRIPIVPISI